MGRVSLNNKIVHSGESFIHFVNASTTLASCREEQPPGQMPCEELGIAVLEVRPNCV